MPWATSIFSRLDSRHLHTGLVTLYCALLGTVLFVGGPHWWSCDDLVILKHAMAYPFSSFFLSPFAWRDLTSFNLTPWLSLSYKVDWQLFGFHPFAYHLHQLVLLVCCLVFFYFILFHWFSVPASLAAVTLLAFSRPFVVFSQVLMVRHYVCGLLFALASTWAFFQAGRTYREKAFRYWTILALCLFILACTAKEIYVPLPLVLAVLPWTSFKRRLMTVTPMMAWLAVYPLWRYWMLGYLVPGQKVPTVLPPAKVFAAKLFSSIGVNPWVFAALALAFAVLARRLGRSHLLFMAVLAATALLPILPVSVVMSPRYALVPTIAFCLSCAWILDRAGMGRIVSCFSPQHLSRCGFPWQATGSMVLAVLLVGYAVTVNRVAFGAQQARELQRVKAEGEFVLHRGSAGDFILDPAGRHQFYDGLSWFRTAYFKGGEPPQALFDPIALVEAPHYRLYRYDPGKRTLVATPPTPAIRSFFRRLRWDKPLSVKLHYHYPVFQWAFGPYSHGQYAFITGNPTLGVYRVPRTGRMVGLFRQSATLRIKYQSPRGWITYSPPLVFEVEKRTRGDLCWQRPAKTKLPPPGFPPHRSPSETRP